ncbi:MAG: hypothetical protein J7L91_01715, partial [Candidatus Korarchaeota archaeon]|nr:hypothetical protein [Candidatus Korarchaeota archaeon]
ASLSRILKILPHDGREEPLSHHEGESSGFEIEKLSEGGPFLIHRGGVKLSKRGRGVLISGVGPC